MFKVCDFYVYVYVYHLYNPTHFPDNEAYLPLLYDV